MSSRKKIRRRPQRPILEQLVGERAARRTRVIAAIVLFALIAGGCALFLFESQTWGWLALALGLGGAGMWLGLRYIGRTGDDPLEALQRRRRPLIAAAAVVLAGGWIMFFAVWEELGLLLVLLGALPLLALTAGTTREPLASPLDGPPFGDTGPT